MNTQKIVQPASLIEIDRDSRRQFIQARAYLHSKWLNRSRRADAERHGAATTETTMMSDRWFYVLVFGGAVANVFFVAAAILSL